MLCNPKACKNGLIYIKDILNENKTNFKTYTELNEVFPGCLSWLEYRGICAAIPNKWKGMLENVHVEKESTIYECIVGKEKKLNCCTIIYWKTKTHSYSTTMSCYPKKLM